jgi:hypothetical protein
VTARSKADVIKITIRRDGTIAGISGDYTEPHWLTSDPGRLNPLRRLFSEWAAASKEDENDGE